MEENKNLQEEVIPTAEGAVVEEAQVAAEAVVTEVIEEAPSK